MRLLDTPPHYRAFLLRFWADHGQAPDSYTWRFTLEDPHSGERQGFGDLETLVAWLRTEMHDEMEQPQSGSHMHDVDWWHDHIVQSQDGTLAQTHYNGG